MSNFKTKIIAFILAALFCSCKQILLQKNKFNAMSNILTKIQADDIIYDKTKKAKPLKTKALRYIKAEKGFMLHDGSVLFLRNNTYQLISFEEFSKALYDAENAMLKEYHAEEILHDRDNNLNAFFKMFDKNRYNFTIESLENIDKDIKILKRKGTYDSEIFIPLVTYIGEVFILNKNGKWIDIDKNNHPVIAIIGNDGRIYDPYLCVREGLIEDQKNHYLYSSITIQL